jgi:hypothetical protein
LLGRKQQSPQVQLIVKSYLISISILNSRRYFSRVMKKYFVAILLLFSFGLLISAEDKSTQPGARERLIGTWRLVSAENVQPDGSSQRFPEYGPHPIGYLMYDSTGHMCVTLANPNPRIGQTRRIQPMPKEP